MEEIKVSIFCLTYNQEKYICQCLNNLVNQKTNFDYEILVHNDASTDSTSEILKGYEEKYPNKIKLINQTENQYSRNVRIIGKFLLPIAKGKYVAWCEGDDYWCDENKLQKQYEIMENNQSCNLCISRVQAINEDGTKSKRTYPRFNLNSGIIDDDDFINYVISDFSFHLSSFLIKKDTYIDYNNKLPDFSRICPVPDLALLLYYGTIGKVYFIDNIVSCYRLQALGSWTSSQKNKSIQQQVEYENKLIEMMKSFNLFSNQKYISYCSKYILQREFSIYRRNNDSKKLKKEKYKCVISNMPLKSRIILYLQIYFMPIYKFIKN